MTDPAYLWHWVIIVNSDLHTTFRYQTTFLRLMINSCMAQTMPCRYVKITTPNYLWYWNFLFHVDCSIIIRHQHISFHIIIIYQKHSQYNSITYSLWISLASFESLISLNSNNNNYQVCMYLKECHSDWSFYYHINSFIFYCCILQHSHSILIIIINILNIQFLFHRYNNYHYIIMELL